MKQAIVNGRIIGSATAGRGYVEWDGGVITAVGEGDYQGDAGLVTDAGGDWVSPGFIDIHTHGAGGHDFMDCTVEAYLGAAEMSARHGAHDDLSDDAGQHEREPVRDVRGVPPCAAAQYERGEHAGLLSEGPYFAYNQRGAQDPRYPARSRVPKSTMRFLPPATIFAGCRWLPSSTVRSNWDGCCARKGFWRR